MRFMNEHDVDRAERLYCGGDTGDHDVLGPAVRTLRSLMDAANRCSDGWAYWPKPVRAAAKLMDLIERDGTAVYMQSCRPDATEAELRAANRVLKTFRTRNPSCVFRIYGPGGDPEPRKPSRVEYRIAGWPLSALASKTGETIPAHAVVRQSDDGTAIVVTFVPAEVE